MSIWKKIYGECKIETLFWKHYKKYSPTKIANSIVTFWTSIMLLWPTLLCWLVVDNEKTEVKKFFIALRWPMESSGKNRKFLPCLSLIFEIRELEFWKRFNFCLKEFWLFLSSYLMILCGNCKEVALLLKGWITMVVPLTVQIPC